MENNILENKIESILFWKGEPVKIEKLAEILETNTQEIEKAISNLQNNLSNRGIALINYDNKISLVTSPENSQLIEKIKKEELLKDLSKASIETLTVILYQSPIKRSKIDYIRGVNSQFTLRILLIRGLIEKEISKDDERTYIYKPSIELLSYLGISKIEDLPEYETVRKDIESFIESEQAQENKEEQNITNE